MENNMAMEYPMFCYQCEQTAGGKGLPPVVFLCTDRKAVKFENNSLDLECAQGCIVMSGALERQQSKGAE